MAKRSKPLTNTQILNAKPRDKLYRLYDGEGLCLKITTAGSKIWEYRFRNPQTRKDDTLILGEYPLMSLSVARERHLKFRQMVADNINPKAHTPDQSFKTIFEQWHAIWSQNVAEKTAKEADRMIQEFCMPTLAHIDITQINTPQIISTLRKVEEKGSLSQIRRVKNKLNQIFNFAIANGISTNNPTIVVTNDLFKKHIEKPHRSLKLNEIYQLHALFRDEEVPITTRNAIEMLLRSMLRLQEVTEMRFDFINTRNNIIQIPAHIMKTKVDHIVPIVPQIQRIIAEQSDNGTPFIFPQDENSTIKKGLPTQTLAKFDIDSTVHGFRHLASTILNETLLFHPILIEVSLAHKGKGKERDKIAETYNKAKYIEKRREIMSWWSDFIDQCDTKENNERMLDQYEILMIDHV